MSAPSVSAVTIAARSDRRLFEHMMKMAGLRLVVKDRDPLRTSVQNEAVNAVASIISEDSSARVQISRYHRNLKEMAEKMGYLVKLESIGGETEDDLFDDGEVYNHGIDDGMDDEIIDPNGPNSEHEEYMDDDDFGDDFASVDGDDDMMDQDGIMDQDDFGEPGVELPPVEDTLDDLNSNFGGGGGINKRRGGGNMPPW